MGFSPRGSINRERSPEQQSSHAFLLERLENCISLTHRNQETAAPLAHRPRETPAEVDLLGRLARFRVLRVSEAFFDEA
jgi:hypothetical protein